MALTALLITGYKDIFISNIKKKEIVQHCLTSTTLQSDKCNALQDLRLTSQSLVILILFFRHVVVQVAVGQEARVVQPAQCHAAVACLQNLVSLAPRQVLQRTHVHLLCGRRCLHHLLLGALVYLQRSTNILYRMHGLA